MTFKEWILQFKEQDTPFGDLAKDIYLSLDEISEEIENKNNIIPFPIQ